MDQAIKARLISRGRNKNGGPNGKAEVVSWIGEGPGRRSVTSHIKLTGGDHSGTGNNPDRAAVARLDAAEKAADKAGKVIAPLVEAVADIEEEIFLLKDTRTSAKAAGMDDEATERAYQKARRALGKRHREAVAKRDAKLPSYQAATEAADKVRAEVPRYPEFIF